MIKPKTKHCPKCDKTKLLMKFGKHSKRYDGRQSYCRDCMYSCQDSWNKRNRDKKREYDRASKSKNPEKHKQYSLHSVIRSYGIEPDEYYKLLREQNFVCAICKRPNRQGNRRLHIDHCHKTGTVRGLLCHGCNSGIGQLDDSVELLTVAIDYLNKKHA